jgi:1,4-alpha-glucan branching enzyme
MTTITSNDTTMKSVAKKKEAKSLARANGQATSFAVERSSKSRVDEDPSRKNETSARRVLFLLERFPIPDKERVCVDLYAPDAQAVFVAGSFNHWQTSATPLHKQASGRWVVELMLERGRHEYRFVIDGQWANDPWSSALVRNPFGSTNCVLRVAIQA